MSAPKPPDLNDALRAGKVPNPFDPAHTVRVLPNGKKVPKESAAARADEVHAPPPLAPMPARAKRPSKFAQLVALAEQYEVFTTPAGLVYVEVDGCALPVTGDAFASQMTREFFDSFGAAVKETDLKTLGRLLRARCKRRESACVRTAEHGEGWWIDLGTDDKRAVCVRPGDVRLEARAPVAFARPRGSGALPDPVFPRNAGEARAALRRSLFAAGCSTNRAAVSLFAWWCSVLRPRPPYAILILRGAAGSGKSLTAAFASRFLDPRRPNLQRFPSLEDLPLIAENAHTLGFDNLSKITQAESDALCCLSTGDAMQKRALYTGRDLETFEAAKPVVLTSVVDAATAGDLLDRSLVVTLASRSDRCTPEELEERFAAAHAEGLGAMLWLAAQARLTADAMRPPASVRLRAVAALAAAGEQLVGFPEGAIYAAFSATHDDALEVASEDALAGPLVQLVKRYGGSWIGTTEELATDLREDFPGVPMPKTPHAIRSAISRLTPALHGLGISLERRRENVRREMVFRYAPPNHQAGPLDEWLEDDFEP